MANAEHIRRVKKVIHFGRAGSKITKALNVSEKLNELVERELSPAPPRDWRDVLKRPAPAVNPMAYELCLRPE
jgi:hypothetical protein